MKNDLTCAVVQDILPLYTEGLTSAETDEAVERHMESCAECTEFKNNLIKDNEVISIEDDKEINYLKSVKRSTKHKIIAAVLITAAVICAAVGYKAFFIGTPLSGLYGIQYSFNDNNDGTFTLNIEPPTHKTVNSWSFIECGGEAEIDANEVLPSPFFISTGYTKTFNYGDTEEIYLCGSLIWKDGIEITDNAKALLETKTPYVGDISAIGRVAERLNIYGLCGSCSIELHTTEEPYGWTFCFNDTYGVNSQRALNANMERSAIQLITLIENLSFVNWRYTDEAGNEQEYGITLEEINEVLPIFFNDYNKKHGTHYDILTNVKDYAEDEVGMQQLINVLGEYYG